jgi:hypothetical protein
MNQWKKILCLVLALVMLMLAGCESSGNGRSRRRERDDEDEELKQVMSVEIEFHGMDGSWYNDNGEILVSHIYEQVVVLGDSSAAEKINEQIEKDGETFVASRSIYIYDSEEEMEDYLQLAGIGYDELCHDACADVTHNGDGILSIRVETTWFMGGVFNADYYGMTFDLTTGDRLNVLELMGGDPAEAEEKLNEIICEYVTEAYGEGLFDAPERILEDYSVEAYKFYVEEGQIIVTFDTYTFAPGAAGATVVPTGIMIGE